MFELVEEFEKQIATFFGSPYAVAVDCCTHGIEICLRYEETEEIIVPKRTYLSVPMLANKLGIGLRWKDENWKDYYYLDDTKIIDAAVLWEKGSYIPGTHMCVSFQYRKHLNLGRGGIILTDDEEAARIMKMMSYDGRNNSSNTPWVDQDIKTYGYHYYMTPETAEKGLSKLPDAIERKPKQWKITDWPDLTNMTCFKEGKTMTKKALITGISGQDGSYLSEYLINLGYEVHGIVRRNSVAENQTQRLEGLQGNIKTYYGDMTDVLSLQKIFDQVKPDEVYNLAAMSHVRVSFDVPHFTINTNGLGVLNILETLRTHAPEAKYYQASSSEMFGNSVDEDGVQRLTTPMNPTSPYGCAKLLAYHLTKHYRNAYNLHACNGILFNHESPRRGSNFVTNKVVKTAVQIKKGLTDKLELGNLDSSRDWGHSKDYVRAMHMIVNHQTPEEFIVATGETRTVRDLCKTTFDLLDLNYEDYVVQNPIYMRPEELRYLKGDASKATNILGWKPEYNFESMIEEMVGHWMETI